jgi:hypothetical protein
MEQKEIINGNGVGNLAIVPDAEPNSSASSNVSATQEDNFFNDSGRQYNLQHN